MKKCFFERFTLIIAVLSLLLAACGNPAGLPEGYGRVAVVINGQASQATQKARTVFPATASLSYEYEFTKEFDGVVPTPAKNGDGSFTLENGNYTVKVDAYTTSSGSVKVASGTSAQFSLSGNATANVTLVPETSTTGTGTFSYAIKYPKDATITEFSLTNISGSTPITNGTPQLDNDYGVYYLTSSQNIPAGIYFLNLKLKLSNAFIDEWAGANEVVYIYDSLNSVYGTNGQPIEFKQDHFSAAFDGETFYVSSGTQWPGILYAINFGGNDKNYTIIVTGDVAIVGSNSTTFGTPAGIKVTLKGSGKLYLSSQGNLLNIGNNQEVILDSASLTLEGLKNGQNDAVQDNNAAVVYISGGTFTMKNGVVKGNSNVGNILDSGGGVQLAGGIFNMSGGEISGNTGYAGGGVGVSGGTFNMSGGVISGNTATSLGGGVGGLAGNIRISNGTIYGTDAGSPLANTATATPTSAALAMSGSSAEYGPNGSGNNLTNSATTIMVVNGKLPEVIEITNAAQWIAALPPIKSYNDKSYVIVINPTGTPTPGVIAIPPSDYDDTLGSLDNVDIIIRGQNGNEVLTIDSPGSLLRVGVRNVTVENLTLQGLPNNTHPLVYINMQSSFTMNSGAKVTGNINPTSGGYNIGGGVSISTGATFTMNGGEVSSNTASAGGGVYFFGSGTFILNDGKVSGNTGTSGGGGVYDSGGTKINMTGGEISGNISGSMGGGVYLSSATFNMTGGKISGNQATSFGGGVIIRSTGKFYIETGAVYGSDVDPPLKNTASSGAALYNDGAQAQRGIFATTGDPTTTFTPADGGTLTSPANSTINILKGKTVQ